MNKKQKRRFNELKRKNFNEGLTEEEAMEYVALVRLREEPKKARWSKKVNRSQKFDEFWLAHRDSVMLVLMGANVILCAFGLVLSLIKIFKG